MIITVERICFCKSVANNVLFVIENSVGKGFAVSKDTKITLHDKQTDIDTILCFFKTHHRPVAEIGTIGEGEYILRHINFMALE